MNKDTLNLLTAAELKCENPDIPIFVLVEKCAAQKGSHDRWIGEIADVRLDKFCFIDDIIHLKSEHSDLKNVEWEVYSEIYSGHYFTNSDLKNVEWEDVIVIEIDPFV